MAITRGRVRAISISTRKGIPKANVAEAQLQADFGLVGDAHAGSGHRQVSLLAGESIDRLRESGLSIEPGEFAENITTEGIDLRALKVGDRLRIGAVVAGANDDSPLLEVTQLGKRCHSRCAIFQRLGDCAMPREGVFARVTQSGWIRVGDMIEVLDDQGPCSHGE